METQTQICTCVSQGSNCGDWSGSFSLTSCFSGCGGLRNGEGRVEKRTTYLKEGGVCLSQDQERRLRCQGIENGQEGESKVVQDWCVKEEGDDCDEDSPFYESEDCTPSSPSLPPSSPPSPSPPPPPLGDEVVVAIIAGSGFGLVVITSFLASRFLSAEQLESFMKVLRTVGSTFASLTGKGGGDGKREEKPDVDEEKEKRKGGGDAKTLVKSFLPN